jgi:DNA-binding NarL/FixJ family response regulator
VVVEGSVAAVQRACDELAAQGWPLIDEVDDARQGVVWRGVVDSEAAAQRAVLAALAGAGVVVAGTAERDVLDRLCDDLRRLGRLDHRLGEPPPAATLSADEEALLAHLLAGASLGEAARALHLSRRTADRRLSSARRALGAASTSEAVVLAARRGVRPAQRP